MIPEMTMAEARKRYRVEKIHQSGLRFRAWARIELTGRVAPVGKLARILGLRGSR